MGGVVGKV
jgi:hypothetical protein